MTKKYDFIVVGGGISALVLAYFLMKKGQRILLFDKNDKVNASLISSGICNPITGRRVVKTWNAETFFPCAYQFYSTLENELNTKLFSAKKIVKQVQNIDEWKAWQKRNEDESYRQYFTLQENNFVEIKGFAIDAAKFIRELKNYLRQKIDFIENELDYKYLELSNNKVFYQKFESKNIVFCEGFAVHKNPWFQDLPFRFYKGDRIIISSSELKCDAIYKIGQYVVPLENKQFWSGSINTWDLNETFENKEKLLKKVVDNYPVYDVKVIDYQFAVRPTVIDRKPIIGTHQQFSSLHIFNGMGTKGFTLAPYWANIFSDCLIENKKIDSEVNLNRFFLA